MLRSISWIQFGSFLLVTGGSYYLYVLGRFYRKGFMAFLSGKGRRAPRADSAAPPGLFGRVVESEDKMPELFKVMDKAITLLKGVVSQGVTNKISREELLDQLTDMLRLYHQLKDTPYQDAVNCFLARTCMSNFSVLLDDEELKKLWQ